MFTKFNKWFDETAADPVRRHAAIAYFSKQRSILIGCALVVTACAATMFFTTTRSPSSPPLLVVSAALMWIIVMRVSCWRRVLTLIDKFSKDEKPAA